MIIFEFQGSVIEGQLLPHREGEAFFVFRVQHPLNRPVYENPPTLDGQALEPIARVRNRAMGRDTSTTTEFEVREPGHLVVESYMSLDGSPQTFRFGVQENESGILLIEEERTSFHWFVDNDFIEAGEDGRRQLFCPFTVEPARASSGTDDGPFVRRILGDDSF